MSEEKKVSLKEKLIPLSLTIFAFVADQITKCLVVANIKPGRIGFSLFGDFFQLIYVCNTGVAFSFGSNFSDNLRTILFSFCPLIILILVLVVYFKNNDFTKVQRWAIAGIVGGGFGNIFDRFFRPNGVVDFIDIKFYGLFGFERWPTFNVADMAVLISGCVMIVSFLMMSVKEERNKKTVYENGEK